MEIGEIINSVFTAFGSIIPILFFVLFRKRESIMEKYGFNYISAFLYVNGLLMPLAYIAYLIVTKTFVWTAMLSLLWLIVPIVIAIKRSNGRIGFFFAIFVIGIYTIPFVIIEGIWKFARSGGSSKGETTEITGAIYTDYQGPKIRLEAKKRK